MGRNENMGLCCPTRVPGAHGLGRRAGSSGQLLLAPVLPALFHSGMRLVCQLGQVSVHCGVLRVRVRVRGEVVHGVGDLVRWQAADRRGRPAVRVRMGVRVR